MLHVCESVDVIDALIAAGASLTTKNSSGYTPAMAALLNGPADAVVRLLRADLMEILSDRGHSVLELAIRVGSRAKMQRLIEVHGEALKATILNSRNADGETPLLVALNGGDEKIVKMLLDLGADARAAAADGRTPAMLVAWDPMLDMLIDAQGDLDLETKDNEGRTLLWWVAAAGKADWVVRLLDRGASPNNREESTNTTVLFNYVYKTRNLDAAIFKRLVEGTPDLTAARSSDGMTVALALLNFMADHAAMPECLQLLRDKGAAPLDA